MPKVSIIIPVYNAEKYIEATINSILSQSLSDWELLLIDDCSKDNSSIICKEFSQLDKRIVYIKQSANGGPARARNSGLEHAKGEFIAFVDSDDTIEPIFLERLVTTAEEKGADIVWCNYKEISNDNITYRNHKLPCRSSIPYDTYIRLFFSEQEGLGSMCTKLYRKEFIEQNKLRLNTERVHGEDWEFNMTCFRCHPVLVAIENSLYNYIRQNNDSVIASYRAQDYQTYVDSNKLLIELALKENIEYDIVAMRSRFVYLVIQLLIALKRSNVQDKKSEFNRIVKDEYFLNIVKLSSWIVEYLPIRYKLYLFLIKCRLIRLAYLVM
jgi:glycosyltransferase involved in cell wall biosynthesis